MKKAPKADASEPVRESEGKREDQAVSREIAGFVARALAPETLPRPTTSQSRKFTGPNPEDHA